jgi:DNA-directed RNA polymerase
MAQAITTTAANKSTVVSGIMMLPTLRQLLLLNQRTASVVCSGYDSRSPCAISAQPAPNFVHTCDAAHLMLTVNAAVEAGIKSIATVHDSFGCLPSHAERFREIILEQFVRMYEENDVLKQVLDQAREDLGENAKGLPEKRPEWGKMDTKQVRKAEFAFA